MSELFGRSEQGARGLLWSIYEGREGDFVNARLVASFSDRKEAWDYIEQAKKIAELGDELREIFQHVESWTGRHPISSGEVAKFLEMLSNKKVSQEVRIEKLEAALNEAHGLIEEGQCVIREALKGKEKGNE